MACFAKRSERRNELGSPRTAAHRRILALTADRHALTADRRIETLLCLELRLAAPSAAVLAESEFLSQPLKKCRRLSHISRSGWR